LGERYEGEFDNPPPFTDEEKAIFELLRPLLHVGAVVYEKIKEAVRDLDQYMAWLDTWSSVQVDCEEDSKQLVSSTMACLDRLESAVLQKLKGLFNDIHDDAREHDLRPLPEHDGIHVFGVGVGSPLDQFLQQSASEGGKETKSAGALSTLLSLRLEMDGYTAVKQEIDIAEISPY
jgi:hypothetical protein